MENDTEVISLEADDIKRRIGNQKETNQKLFFDGQIYDALHLKLSEYRAKVRKEHNLPEEG